MTRISELEIYKTVYVLCREMARVRGNMPRGLKFEIGSEMSQSALLVLRGVIKAARAESKIDELHEVLTECEVLWTWLRLAYDLRAMSMGEFSLLSERLDHLTRQAATWTKSLKVRGSGPSGNPAKGVMDPHGPPRNPGVAARPPQGTMR